MIWKILWAIIAVAAMALMVVRGGQDNLQGVVVGTLVFVLAMIHLAERKED